MNSGDSPVSSPRLHIAPALMRSCATSKCPDSTARNNAVREEVVIALRSAPRLISSCTQPFRLLPAATRRGVNSFSATAWMFALLSIRTLAIGRLPRSQATNSGVHLFPSAASTFALLATRSSTLSRCCRSAATYSAVAPPEEYLCSCPGACPWSAAHFSPDGFDDGFPWDVGGACLSDALFLEAAGKLGTRRGGSDECSLSLASSAAPCFTRSWSTSRKPWQEAMCSGVHACRPAWLLFGSAFWDSKKSTTLGRSFCAARKMGVLPSPDLALIMSTPDVTPRAVSSKERSSLTTSKSPAAAAT
mmetsp:Transcript_50468/g.120064  ORF Transcript_50468/g.120064 Transcript_50468/m.120064 type:complete len:304 (+) Transcript_50468:906-1817(+)